MAEMSRVADTSSKKPAGDDVLIARIAKAIEDTAKVGEFKIHVCDNDIIVYIRTTWGPEINHYALRKDWRKPILQALDELDDIKPGTEPSTDMKE